jgi:2-C-methyl-D-erythritol 2,4-cyclodiphosphate synthase
LGFDVHPFVEGRPLVLCGVTVPYPKGLDGHSDADAACHALADSLLGALALGDVGVHFPSTDPKWAGASSIDLLSMVYKMVLDRGYRAGNVDVTIVAQEPKVLPYTGKMRDNLSATLSAPRETVSVKATTTDRLGFCGRGEGIAALAVSLLLPADGPAK